MMGQPLIFGPLVYCFTSWFVGHTLLEDEMTIQCVLLNVWKYYYVAFKQWNTNFHQMENSVKVLKIL